MADQIVLAWTVDVARTTFGPAQAATALAAVPLYTETETDPVLGQLFGVTVASDVTAAGATTATRTLTLNMTGVGPAAAVPAPPMFECTPRPAQPGGEIEPPFPLVSVEALVGSFFATIGSPTVATTVGQPSTLVGQSVRFASNPNRVYPVIAVGATTITLDDPFEGPTGSTSAEEEVADPIVVAAIFSTSPLDTDGVAGLDVPILPGPGARTIDITYTDSTGAGPFTVSVDLTGKMPALIALAGGSIDIAVVESMVVASVGSFGNSVGQLTLVELSQAPRALPATPTQADFLKLVDETQMSITRRAVYLPPSYFALSAQMAATPALEGDFFVSTGSKHVPTSADQTAVLAAGNVIQFASQPKIYSTFGTIDVFYTIASVGPKSIELTGPYSGVDDNFTGQENVGVNSNNGTMGNVGSEVENKRTAAWLVDPSPAVAPTNTQLAGLLAQFVAPETATPPPDPPLPPATIPTPTFLSGLFTRTIQLAMKGVPVSSATITFV